MKTIRALRKDPRFELRAFVIDVMIFDLWLLKIAQRWAKRAMIFVRSILKIFVVLAVGAGLISYYAMSTLKLEISTFEDASGSAESSQPRGLIGIADASEESRDHRDSGLEREIDHLRNKALSLEIALRRMVEQYFNYLSSCIIKLYRNFVQASIYETCFVSGLQNSQLRSFHTRDRCREEDLADFASEAAGGSVLDTPDTVSFFEPKDAQLTLFGITLCKPSYFTPRKVIQPWSQAGECWAFRGDRGNVKIELAYAAFIDQVTLEHISVSASLTGKIDSAPKDFRVSAQFPEGSITVGIFVYNQYGPPSQIFQVTEERFKDIPIKTVMLEILSNWGNPNYTCIYRFKVHGKISL